MRKKEKKRKMTLDTICNLLWASVLVYGVMLLVYVIYLILCIFKAI